MNSIVRLLQYLQISPNKLNLSGCRDTLTDDHVGDIVVRCPHLLEFVVSDAVLLSDVSVGHVCAGLQLLRSFRYE